MIVMAICACTLVFTLQTAPCVLGRDTPAKCVVLQVLPRMRDLQASKSLSSALLWAGSQILAMAGTIHEHSGAVWRPSESAPAGVDELGSLDWHRDHDRG